MSAKTPANGMTTLWQRNEIEFPKGLSIKGYGRQRDRWVLTFPTGAVLEVKLKRSPQ